ncbi:ABC transporter permease [Salicibibacter cibarius]|uniref:ABC transporter permease n=1 Tax=Salicibibacter cibarius TaxID=2743000 RepID=UPI001FEC2993|nr:ABC transporter permease [Salicibibacter cibarius]
MGAKLKIAAFVATLAMMGAVRAIALYTSDGGSISGEVAAFSSIANSSLGVIHSPFIIFIIMTVLVFILVHHTRFGRYVYAVGSNEKGALLSGIRVTRVKMAVYTLAGTLVGVAAIIEASRLNSISSYSSGQLYELDAIAAVIIDGTRMIGGAARSSVRFSVC